MNKKIATIAGLAIAASGATADVLLEIDLSVANEVTISATTAAVARRSGRIASRAAKSIARAITPPMAAAPATWMKGPAIPLVCQRRDR